MIYEGFGYLNIITEDLVVIDLESSDARGFLFPLLDASHNLVTVISYGTVIINVGIISVTYHSAVSYTEWRHVYYFTTEKIGNVVKRVDAVINFFYIITVFARKKLLYFFRRPKRRKVACRKLLFGVGDKKYSDKLKAIAEKLI